ncbi:MAG: hypothetical protein ACOC5C_06165 [Halobacteriota archaeon]
MSLPEKFIKTELILALILVTLLISGCMDRSLLEDDISAKKAYTASAKEVKDKYPDAFLVKLEAGSWRGDSHIKDGKSPVWHYSYYSPPMSSFIDGVVSENSNDITKLYRYENEMPVSSLNWRLDSTEAFNIASRVITDEYSCVYMELSMPPKGDSQWKMVFFPPDEGRITARIVTIDAQTGEKEKIENQTFVSR